MRKSTKRIAIGSVVAATAGYVAGILTAPKSGKQTRKDIQQATLKAKAEAEKKLKVLHSELGDLITKGSTQASKLTASTKKELVQILAGAQLTKEKAREILSAVHEGDADDKDLQKAVKDAAKAVDHLKKYLGKKPS